MSESSFLDFYRAREAARRREQAERETIDLALFTPLGGEEPAPPHNGTVTSKAAAVAAREHAHADRQRILAYLVEQGDRGATREEIEHALAMNGNTVRPRVFELLHEPKVWQRFGASKSLLTEPGHTRLTRSGSPAAVLLATREGIVAVGVRHAA